MKKKRPLLNAVLLILLILFLLSFAASFDNIVSRKIAEWLNKPAEVIRDFAQGGVAIVLGVILVVAGAIAASVVVGIVLVVAGIVLLGWGLYKWFGGGESKATNPENTKLDSKG